jgi:hypothetical protein
MTDRRPMFFRVTTDAPRPIHGVIRDLRTLKGATARLERTYPSWQEIEVQYTPFAGQDAATGRTAAP